MISKGCRTTSFLFDVTPVFYGDINNRFFSGKPILSALSNEYSVLVATGSWWVVFYSPGDLGYTLARNKVGGSVIS